ncbi:MAG: hypothetical protein E7289_10515 [Lachnospiraceae bacterium]|nr:hypothetical protein [Lachnospiraceae bacterium]
MKKKNKANKQYHKPTYVFSILIFTAAAVAFVHWAVRPRPSHLGIALVLLVSGWNVYRKAPLEIYQKDPKKNSKSVRGYLYGLPILLWITVVFLSPLELVFPSHMPWEYKWEMKAMKEDFSARYYYFPDEIPKGATDVVWKQYPGYLQGKAFKYLMFSAEDTYIQGELEKYAGDATPLTYEQVSVYPLFQEVAPERWEEIKIYLLYKGENPEEYPSAMGIMVDEEQGMICYFFE